MTIYRFSRNVQESEHIMNMQYKLTDLQNKGSEFLYNCYLFKQSGFLQAVCGAGKTEMTYKTILKALNNGEIVGFVIPRVEVLKEVFKRFRSVFEKTHT